VASPAVIEEVVADAWLEVLAGIDRFRGASSLKIWIFSILVNRATTRRVRAGRVKAAVRRVLAPGRRDRCPRGRRKTNRPKLPLD